MSEDSYLKWMSSETQTSWWNDSGISSEITASIDHGAVGVTTNPILIYRALSSNRNEWKTEIQKALRNHDSSDKAVALTGVVVKKASALLYPVFKQTDGNSGYACSQVDPALSGNREEMLEAAVEMNNFGENISVKLPATSAGLDVMEECVSRGIHVTVTVSFTLSQVLAIAERYRSARKKAKQIGKNPGKCFAVVMIGRLDDYIRDISLDMKANVDEIDIQSAGLAVVKRAYSIYQQENYEAELIIAAMRGTYHITELAGSKMIMSIHPDHQDPFLDNTMPKKELIENPVDPESIKKLMSIPEFIKAYEPDGMKPDAFISYGAVQRTLTQFSELGWKRLEGF